MAWHDVYDQQYANLQAALNNPPSVMGVSPAPWIAEIQRQMQAVVAARDAEAQRRAQEERTQPGGGGVTGAITGTTVTPPASAFSAQQMLDMLIKQTLGIEGVSAWAADLYKRGASALEIVQALRYGTDTSEAGRAAHEKYLQAFPGMDEFIKDGTFAGENPELQYIGYRNTVKEAAARYGIDASLVTPDAIKKYIAGKNSAAELADRMSMAASAIASTPEETYTALREYYGINGNDLMSFYLDTDNTEALLRKRYTAAQFGGIASRQGFGVGAGYAETLVERGTTQEQAQTGFQTAAKRAEFTVGRGDTIDQTGLLEASFGSQQEADVVARIAQARENRFAGGGAFEADRSGYTGIGSSSR